MDKLFDRLANRYDAWFDSAEGRRIFLREMECLRALMAHAPRPWLEVGIGTGRFAGALGVDAGVDKSLRVLELAARHGIPVCRGDAAALPYATDTFGGVLMTVTISYLADPVAALRECARVLRPDGVCIIGFVPSDSPLAAHYEAQGRQGDRVLAAATFYRSDEVTNMARDAGMSLGAAMSCLVGPPAQAAAGGHPLPIEGVAPEAGYVALRFAVA